MRLDQSFDSRRIQVARTRHAGHLVERGCGRDVGIETASRSGHEIHRDGRGVAWIGFAQRLEKAGSLFFAASPVARQRLAHLAGQDPRYLAHEYFNASWAPFYHADVARELGQAKLGFAGPATTLDCFNQFLLRPEAAKLVAEAPDRTTAETIKDFARNCVFRSDLFTRGAPHERHARRTFSPERRLGLRL